MKQFNFYFLTLQYQEHCHDADQCIRIQYSYFLYFQYLQVILTAFIRWDAFVGNIPVVACNASTSRIAWTCVRSKRGGVVSIFTALPVVLRSTRWPHLVWISAPCYSSWNKETVMYTCIILMLFNRIFSEIFVYHRTVVLTFDTQ